MAGLGICILPSDWIDFYYMNIWLRDLDLIHLGIINSFISDHRPIILKWNRDELIIGVPFKFNCVWLEDPDFDILVKDFWTQFKTNEDSPMAVILEKLHALKVVVKIWKWNKKNQLNKDLTDISDELYRLSLQLQLGHPSEELCTPIRALEKQKKKLSCTSKRLRGD